MCTSTLGLLKSFPLKILLPRHRFYTKYAGYQQENQKQITEKEGTPISCLSFFIDLLSLKYMAVHSFFPGIKNQHREF